MVTDSKFFVTDTTVQFDLDDGEWVKLKNEMSLGDWEQLESSMLQIEAEESPNRAARRQSRHHMGNTSPSRAKINAGSVELLYINVTKWSFSVELNRDNIRKLKSSVADAITLRIEELNGENPLEKAVSGLGTI